MRIGIIDADIIGKKNHRFPNLACMKISSYYKSLGHSVDLLLTYDEINNYDKVLISKVFTDTEVPNGVLYLPNVEYGGTGFFYDKAEPLPYEIEHIMPDYHLYDDFVQKSLEGGAKPSTLKYYTDYSIGFTTRGCIRGCSFCVNKNYRQCLLHSPVSEFLDEDRKYICLLDDNVLACKNWKDVFNDLIATGKKIVFHQGMDERLLTDEKCDVIFNKCRWIGEMRFAFDNIKDRNVIERKLKMIRKYTDRQIKFYVFCGYNQDDVGVYNEEFWIKDIEDMFERIKILMNYQCLPYIMRHKDYEMSPYRGIYITAARWCNQPTLFKHMTFEQYAKFAGMNRKIASSYNLDFNQYLKDGNRKLQSWLYLEEFEKKHPEIANKYFHMKWDEIGGA